MYGLTFGARVLLPLHSINVPTEDGLSSNLILRIATEAMHNRWYDFRYLVSLTCDGMVATIYMKTLI
jgi:hypothetical protein